MTAVGVQSLLMIIELGGYPNFTSLYQRLGYNVDYVNSQRKARNWLKKHTPDVIVAEFNFQSDFRDRSSNLETLMAWLQRNPATRLIVFYPPEHEGRFRQFCDSFPVYAGISLPVDADVLEKSLLMP